MNNQTPQNAVSPVVGVILVVAVTVLLSAVVGAFVLGIGQDISSGTTSPEVGTTITTNADGTVTVQVITGAADKLKILVNGTEVDAISTAGPGDTRTVSATADSTISIVAVIEGESRVISTRKPRSTTVNTGPISSFDATQGLVAYWTMDNADISGSTVQDTTGNGHDATIQNTPTTGELGVQNESINFTSDYLTVANNAVFFSDNFTVSAWIHPESFGGSNGNNIVSTDESSAKGWVLRVGNSTPQLTIGDGTKWRSATGPAGSVDAGKWQHIVGVYNGTHILVYVNGTLSNASVGPSSVPDSGLSLTIGQQTTPYSRYFDGRLDEIRFYNRSLSSEEVSALFDQTK